MMVFAIGIKRPLDVPVQRFHDANPREHRRAVTFGNQDQRFPSRPAIPVAQFRRTFGAGTSRFVLLACLKSEMPGNARNDSSGSDLWSPAWRLPMNLVFGLTVSLMLMVGGVWANVSHSGSLSHSQGAWVSR
jgi:hypothetical protein